MKKKNELRDADFLVLVWEIQDANVISNTKKMRPEEMGMLIEVFGSDKRTGL